jgi:molecular chaperone GrpE (heat shock protein)
MTLPRKMNERAEEKNIEEKKEREEADAPSFTVSDRRHWVHHEEGAKGEAPAAEKPRLPSYLEQLRGQLEAKDLKLREFMEKVDRENADFRGRMEREFDRRVEKVQADMILDLLPIIDNLERAIISAEEHGVDDNLLEGVRMVYNQFLGQLKKEGVEQIEVVGKPFDPSNSEALSVVPAEDPEEDDTVSDELEKGYTLNGRLLRPAKVRVRRHSSENK